MGLDSECRVRVAGRTFTARAQLETTEIIIGSRPRIVIPFARIRTARPDGTWLRLDLEGLETADLELGETQAARWAERIRNPKSRVDKLGIKPGHRVAVIGVDDADFASQLVARGAVPESARAGRELDLVFLGAQSPAALDRLEALRKAIRQDGAVWVTWPKGRAELREDDVRAAALRAGLVDVKVVAFSDRLSALKLVIPVARRRATKSAAKPKSARRS